MAALKKLWNKVVGKAIRLSNGRLSVIQSTRDDETSGYFKPYWNNRGVFDLEFNWWTHFAHIGFEFDDGMLELKWGLPPLAVWLKIPLGYDTVEKIVGHPYEGRETEFAIHHWKFWWHVWSGSYGWRSTDPWWMSGSFELNPLTILLGEVRRLSEETVREKEVKVPMPEKEYDATVKIVRSKWGRPRWPRWPFASEEYSSDWDCKEGIPHPGKGTMGYNCGDDALFGGGFGGERSIERTIGRIIGKVLYYRDRYPL